MLVPLLLAATHSVPKTTLHPKKAKTTQQFTLDIPPITLSPMALSSADALHLPRSRKLLPLTVTMNLDDSAQEEADLVTAINRERTARGLETLTPDPALCVAATEHSHEMCDLNYFAHSSPTEGEATPMDRYISELRMTGQPRPAGGLVGENIFYASITSDTYNAGYAHRSLMASPGHRKNILEPRFTKVGIGLYRDSGGQFWVTEMFLGNG